MKTLLIIILAASTVTFAYIAIRNTKPVCDDLIWHEPSQANMYQAEYVCEYGLGDKPISQIRHEVIMVDNK